MDDKQRIALVETRTQGDDGSPAQLIRYQFGNHLGSAVWSWMTQAQIISYEEYYPYGSTSYQAGRSAAEVSLKRYRYTGKERDEETGFRYHGARYYAPWLGRWTSVDPIRLAGGINVYAYADQNPIMYRDETGTEPQPPAEPKPPTEPKPPLTAKEAAAIAEGSGKGALVKKYSSLGTVVDITPAGKNVSATGVTCFDRRPR